MATAARHEGADALGQRADVLFIGPDVDTGGLFGRIQNAWSKQKHGALKSWRTGKVGSITDSLVEDLARSRAVLADIRDENPNVYYEIALAHAFDTPVIPFIEKGQVPRFDIKDQDAVQVETSDDEIANEAYVTDEVGRRLSRLSSSPFRTAITAYRERTAQPQPSAAERPRGRLPLDGWEHLARQELLASLDETNARPGQFVYHLSYGVGEIIESGTGGSSYHEVRAVFLTGPRTLVLPDQRAFLARPAS